MVMTQTCRAQKYLMGEDVLPLSQQAPRSQGCISCEGVRSDTICPSLLLDRVGTRVFIGVTGELFYPNNYRSKGFCHNIRVKQILKSYQFTLIYLYRPLVIVTTTVKKKCTITTLFVRRQLRYNYNSRSSCQISTPPPPAAGRHSPCCCCCGSTLLRAWMHFSLHFAAMWKCSCLHHNNT